jgi:hypothetical protein
MAPLFRAHNHIHTIGNFTTHADTPYDRRVLFHEGSEATHYVFQTEEMLDALGEITDIGVVTGQLACNLGNQLPSPPR